MIIDTYEATPLTDKILLKHYLGIWVSYGVPMQGYYFSRPVSAAEIDDLLRGPRS